MRLYQTGALLTGAPGQLIPDAGVLVDGTPIVAAGPLDFLASEHAIPADVVSHAAQRPRPAGPPPGGPHPADPLGAEPAAAGPALQAGVLAAPAAPGPR